MTVTIKLASADNYEALGVVMFNSVRQGESPYTEAQRRAWMPEPHSGPEWSSRLDRHDIYVAEDHSRAVGFMSLNDEGQIDLAFIEPAHRGTCTFGKLFDAVMAAAIEKSLTRLWVEASPSAEAAFARKGFRVIERQTVTLRGEEFNRCLMDLML